jgi:cyclopropane-fatty-acyl-phospholipid synthase
MQTPSRFSTVPKWLLQKMRKFVGSAPIHIVVGKNAEIAPPDGMKPLASVIISDRETLRKVVLNPEIGFGDGYAQNRIQVQGDLVRLLESVFRAMQEKGEGLYAKVSSWWLERMQANTREGSRKNIHYHYDLTADFYRLWLDEQLVYTCAYFPSPSASLEEAQLAKMDYVCRKVALRPGDTVVEAGCGWGALALHMARHYGAKVKAFNISREQIAYARARAKREGLSDRVEFIEDDYRNIPARTNSAKFDVFMSVGMLEHVGAEHYNELGRVIYRTIGDSGRGLLHFIGRNHPKRLSAWTRKRIFPGAYPPTLRQVMDIFEPWDFSVLDVENLRMHYACTLEHWLERFEKSADRVSQMFGQEFVRSWRLYLAGSVASFRVGMLQLFQVVFAGREFQEIPWTRAHLYTDRESQPERASVKERKWMVATS